MGNELVFCMTLKVNVVLTLRCRIAFGPGAWRRCVRIVWSCFKFFWFGEFVHVLVSQWRIACLPTLFLAFPLAAAVFLIFRWYSREVFVHSMWLIFQFPRCCSPYVFSIGLCFPWIFFNIRWTIWNFYSSFPFNERFQYSLCVLLCLFLNSVEYIKFTPHRSCLEVYVALL